MKRVTHKTASWGSISMLSLLAMGISIKKTCSRAFFALTCIALACNLMMPVGYMPAAHGSSPFMLCHSVLPASFMQGQNAAAATHGNAHDDVNESRVMFCPLGSLAGTLVLPESFTFNTPLHSTEQLFVAEVRRAISNARAPFHSRAPPLDLN